MKFGIVWTFPPSQICAQANSYVYFMYLPQRTLSSDWLGMVVKSIDLKYGFRNKEVFMQWND